MPPKSVPPGLATSPASQGNRIPRKPIAPNSGPSLPETGTASQDHNIPRKPIPQGSSAASSRNRVPETRRPPPLPVKPGKALAKAGITAAQNAKKDTSLQKQIARNPTASTQVHSVSSLSEVDQWKAKYEEQLAETERIRKEMEKTLADNQIQQGEISQLKASYEAVSDKIVDYRDEFIKLKAQAKIAGQLQTDLNVANHVVIPPLEEENLMLKQELNRLLTEPDISKGVKGLGGLGGENPNMPPPASDLSQATRELLAENRNYIETLEKTNETLNDKYLEFVKEMQEEKHRIAALEERNAHLETEAENSFNRIIQLNNDLTELKAEKEGRELEVRELINKNAMAGTKPTPSTVHTPSKFSTSVVTGNSDVSPLALPTPRYPAMSSSKNHSLNGHAQNTPSFLSSPRSKAIQTWPKPPLDKDIRITINAKVSAPEDVGLLGRLTGITTKGTSIQINGPPEVAKALQNGMEQSRIASERADAKILELQRIMWNHVQEIERLKKQGCSVAEHRSLADELKAMEARFEMQELFLADYRRQLTGLKGDK